ncbi:MAG: type III pantothenate kinase [Lachnospiraceae bacterium]|nr:type III pantothenate kinase [Lachnospiraceae bacterium]
MLFAVDIGNTNIVAGVMDDDEIRVFERITTDRNKTDLEYAVIFKNILDLYQITASDIDGAIVSSVVPEINSTLKNALKKLFGCRVLIVGPGVKTGLNIKIDDPAQLGADMVVAAVACINEYPLPQIIFDLGTATTISAIDKDGNFLGGVITAGVRTSVESIISKTSQLVGISFSAPKHAIGKNTVESMQSGSVFGTAAMMDGMIDRISEELGEPASVIATGGLAGYIAPYCRHSIICDDNLLLKGLNIIYKKNS